MIEPILRNQKKAEIISTKIGTAATLEAVSSTTTQPVSHVDSLQFASPYIVVGYSFDKQLTGKTISAPVGGNEGVFVLKVINVSAKANYNIDIEQARQSMLQSQESLIQRAGTDALKKKAKIEDDRSKFL
jgi:peptidyl-prolyl cis-trans isomerase D